MVSPYSRSPLKLLLGHPVTIFLAPVWSELPIAVRKLKMGHQAANAPLFETSWSSTTQTDSKMGQQWWQLFSAPFCEITAGHTQHWGTCSVVGDTMALDLLF